MKNLKKLIPLFLLLTLNAFAGERSYEVLNNEILSEDQICLTTLMDKESNWTINIVEDLYSCELYRFANKNDGQIEINLEHFGLEAVSEGEFASQKLIGHPVYLISIE